MENEKKKSVYLQTNLFSFQSFTQPRQEPTEPFMPIDRSEPIGSAIKSQKRGLGRPRKYEISSNQGSRRNAHSNHQIEEVKESDNQESANNQQNSQSPKPRGHYHPMSYETKLKIITKFIAFDKQRPIIEGKKQSFEEFYKAVGSELSENWQSVKSLCLAYRKNNELLYQLEYLTATQVSAKKNGHIISRPSRLSYDEELDRNLVDWLYGCLEIGYVLTRDIIMTKAKEIINPSCPDFKASDPWLKCFLQRHNMSVRKLNKKAKQKFRSSINLLKN